MDTERRKRIKPVPDNLEELLNEAQIRTLRDLEPFGWKLHFIRRLLFQEVALVLISKEGDRLVVLEASGRVNEKADLDIRDCTPAPELMKKIVG